MPDPQQPQTAGQKIFFNSSMPRSGSTLLQNILAQNPRFYCSPTSGLFDLLYNTRAFYSESHLFKAQDPAVMKRAVLGFCGSGVRGYYAAITDRPCCVDKSRGWVHNYEWIEMFHPDPKILVCIRDLRSIVSSMEKLYRKNRHQKDPEDNPSRSNMTTVRNRVTHWMNNPPVGPQLMRLLDAVERGVDKKVHFVRFEDLTARPEPTMKKVYEFLGEEQFAHDFDNVDQATEEDDQQHGFYGDHKVRRKVEPVPLDYRDVLGEGACQWIKQNYGGYFQRFYPDVR
jgi:sulfotransferase